MLKLLTFSLIVLNIAKHNSFKHKHNNKENYNKMENNLKNNSDLSIEVVQKLYDIS